MTKIYKYPLGLTDVQGIQLPLGAQILTVQVQPGSGLCLWAIVDPEATGQTRQTLIEIIGTGHPMLPVPRRYISTVQLQGGMLVFHIFERLTE